MIDALVDLVDQIYDGFDKKEKTSALLIDLSKAFDTVNHNILLLKLEYYGIRGTSLSLFKSYLTNRKQIVTNNNNNSKLMAINCGVPQGSILGPILFLIYINDLPFSLKHCQAVLFADDTTLINKAPTPNDLEHRETVSLDHAESWFHTNKLKVNTTKTQIITFAPRSDGNNFAKLLGVYLDPALNWKQQIGCICNRLATATFQIRKIKQLVDVSCALLLYYSVFQATINYSIMLWGHTSHSERIFILQKRAIRILAGADRLEHCRPLYKSLKILTVPCLYIYNCLMYVRKNIDKFLIRGNYHNYNARHTYQL